MTQLQVLIPGYAKEIKGGWQASSTVTLIQDSGKNIIVDPGINRPLLLKKLQSQNLAPNDIHIVFMTHFHPDHNFLSSIFTNAIVLDDELVYDNDKQTEYQNFIPGTKIKVISTPGHEKFHGSLIIKTNKGTTVVAGDLWWWTDNQEQDTSSVKTLLNHPDPFVKDPKALFKSRQKVLKIADQIIPGHGQIFQNPGK